MNKEEILFKEIKNGDFIGFHYKSWKYIIAKIIYIACYLFSKNKRIPVEHVGQIINVKHTQGIVYFDFAETTGAEGKTIKKYMVVHRKLIHDNIYYIDSRFNVNKIHFLSLKQKLTEEEHEKIVNFWKQREDYSIIDAITSVSLFEKIRNFFFKNEKLINKDNFCSGACHNTMYIIGRTKNTSQINPVELTMQSYLDVRF